MNMFAQRKVLNHHSINGWYKKTKALIFGKKVNYISLYLDKDRKISVSMKYEGFDPTIILHGEEIIGDWFL